MSRQGRKAALLLGVRGNGLHGASQNTKVDRLGSEDNLDRWRHNCFLHDPPSGEPGIAAQKPEGFPYGSKMWVGNVGIEREDIGEVPSRSKMAQDIVVV